ncbi:MAG: NAD(+)/NADH kinase [Lachnospiraceae bacterium]|jgi:NAD+ kinase
MDNFYILTNAEKDVGGKISENIRKYLTGRGKKCIMINDGNEVTEEYDCMIVIGGDGTVLRAARKTRHKKIPIVGVNMGTLGYLTEITTDNLYESLERLISNDFIIEDRMMLTGEGYRKGDRLFKMTAVNEFQITREGPLTGLAFENYLNGQYMNTYLADGVLISTATGSTGYNLSLGGPIVSPTAKIMVMTPMAAHTLNSRSIVFSENDSVEINITKGKRNSENNAEVICDGDKHERLEIGDRFIIKKSPEKTELIRLNEHSFIETLSHKMNY